MDSSMQGESIYGNSHLKRVDPNSGYSRPKPARGVGPWEQLDSPLPHPQPHPSSGYYCCRNYWSPQSDF
jgi:hypothetical protein